VSGSGSVSGSTTDRIGGESVRCWLVKLEVQEVSSYAGKTATREDVITRHVDRMTLLTVSEDVTSTIDGTTQISHRKILSLRPR
jgi:hypothetical protein